MPLDPADWARSENDTAAGFVVDGDDAAARGLYGEARAHWNRALGESDSELEQPVRHRLQGLAVDRVFWFAAFLVLVLNTLLLVRYIGQ